MNQPEGANKHYNTLLLFTKGRLEDYLNEKAKFLSLNDLMLTKLKLVTLLDILKEKKTCEFSLLKRLLNINDEFELETLIFDAVYQNFITGKIDHVNKTVKVLHYNSR